ncbi:MAG: winged helix-turn-helix transcriptional regulator [Micromonosporaceae bacterium]|jgi:GntR family transcriptional regulator|nr:winged helix-turn-helix transcriptional regulator [Micromonosporaceae bacterium]
MSPAPLFKQVADALADRIAAGNLIPGNPIPSETAIQMEYRVAPWTARAAIAELRKRGLVVTMPEGRTYVREE